MLSALVDSLGVAPSLRELRPAVSCLLAFAAFLRYDKLAKLRCCDIVFSKANMSVRILSSKTNQYWQGDTVLVVLKNTQTCPVAMLERHFAHAKL